ncbi:hypothetical protein KO498_17085 [Lentibacter algarum]|uniref:hypothetical protein n=1 Tax=Lentibacter algarum TaxID=576131 RepID=UPI001C0A19BC|nr:hypothetical protein [Lentibacter algarum]MBU2983524.1 hypothetical protein [Lentibacter algarum]
MKNEWILDVLDDLKAFAKANGLPSLAVQLEDTALMAACELASGSSRGKALETTAGSNGVQHDFESSRANN